MTTFFFGIMLWVRGGAPVAVLLLPLLWALVGMSAALRLGMREDFGLGIGAACALFDVLHRHQSMQRQPHALVGVLP